MMAHASQIGPDSFFLQMPDEFTADSWADKSVDQVGDEEQRQHNRKYLVVKDKDKSNGHDEDDGFEEGAMTSPVDSFKGWILHFADHHGGEEDQQHRQEIAPAAFRESFLLHPQQQERE